MFTFILSTSLSLQGPPKVGRRELRERLIKVEPNRFAPAIPRKYPVYLSLSISN